MSMQCGPQQDRGTVQARRSEEGLGLRHPLREATMGKGFLERYPARERQWEKRAGKEKIETEERDYSGDR